MEAKRLYLFFLIVAVLIFGTSSVMAEDSDLDLFKEIEKEAVTSEEKDLDLFKDIEKSSAAESSAKYKILHQLKDNFAGRIRFRYIRFLANAEPEEDRDMKNDHYEGLFRFNSWTGGDKWRFDIDGWAEAGNQENTYRGVLEWFQDKSRDTRRYFEINELYLVLNQSNYDVTVGKKIFTNGISTLYSPADRFRPQDTHDPLEPKDLGLWQTKLDYYSGKYTLTGAILPIFVPAKNPHETSRWRGSSQSGDSRESEYSIHEDADEDFPDISIENVGFFIKSKTTLRGWDLFTSAYYGPNSYHVLEEEDRDGLPIRIKKTVPIGNIAAGFSTSYKKWEFHAEGLYNQSFDGKEDSYLNAVGGFTYTIDELAKRLFLEKIDITIEYAREWITRRQDAENYTDSSEKNRLGKDEVYVRVDFKVNEDLKFRYGANFEFVDDGRYNHFESEYRIKPGLTWKAAIETFGGSDESYYGRWWRNDRIITSMEYKF